MTSYQKITNMEDQKQVNTNLQGQIDNLQKELGSLRSELASKKQGPAEGMIKQYDVLLVDKLMAGLPVFTAARTDIPKQGQPYITDIGGTRKICVYISGTQYCVTVT